MRTQFILLAIRLLAAAVAATAAFYIARHLAEQRHSATVQPIEAAMIALTVTIGRDIADAALKLAEEFRDHHRAIVTLKEVLVSLQQPGKNGPRAAIPFIELANVQTSKSILDAMHRTRATALDSLVAVALDIKKYAINYDDISPMDAAQFSQRIKDLLVALGGSL